MACAQEKQRSIPKAAGFCTRAGPMYYLPTTKWRLGGTSWQRRGHPDIQGGMK